MARTVYKMIPKDLTVAVIYQARTGIAAPGRQSYCAKNRKYSEGQNPRF